MCIGFLFFANKSKRVARNQISRRRIWRPEFFILPWEATTKKIELWLSPPWATVGWRAPGGARDCLQRAFSAQPDSPSSPQAAMRLGKVNDNGRDLVW